jgi:hypothetical protein
MIAGDPRGRPGRAQLDLFSWRFQGLKSLCHASGRATPEIKGHDPVMSWGGLPIFAQLTAFPDCA